MVNSLIETRSTIIESLDSFHDIIKVERKENYQLTIDDLIEIELAYQRILQGRKGKFLVMTDVECQSDVSFIEAMASGERTKFKAAEALVVDSLSKRLDATYYEKYCNSSHPIQIVNSEQEGIDWLLSLN